MSVALDPVASADPPPIPLRIVVDGASTAGKTTTARSLGERLGRPVLTPQEAADGRTLLFDWLDHTGGRSDGRPIRTQVVAVPGHRPRLRIRLLLTADVVLFVADTTATGIDATVAALAEVRLLLARSAEPRPGVVVQANKRDAPDALPMAEVFRRLELGDDDLVIETVATDGDGVRQAFVYAVRLALQHSRAATGPRMAEHQATADALLAQLEAGGLTVSPDRSGEPQAPAPAAPLAPVPPVPPVATVVAVPALSAPPGASAPAPKVSRPVEPDRPEASPPRPVAEQAAVPDPAVPDSAPADPTPAGERRGRPSRWLRWLDRA